MDKYINCDTPILNQVSPDSVISVRKKCYMKIQWNGEKRSVEYHTSISNRSIIESAMREFNITTPIRQLRLVTQDRKSWSLPNNTFWWISWGLHSFLWYQFDKRSIACSVATTQTAGLLSKNDGSYIRNRMKIRK